MIKIKDVTGKDVDIYQFGDEHLLTFDIDNGQIYTFDIENIHKLYSAIQIFASSISKEINHG